MAKFLLVPHHGREQAALLARQTIDWLDSQGHEAIVLEADAQFSGLHEWSVSSLADQEIDLAVSLGGDGTMLRVLDMVCTLAVPVLGVNFGQLGYLAEVEPDQLRDALRRFIAGDCLVEERMTIDVIVTSAPEANATSSTISLSRQTAVNEVVVERSPLGTTVRLEAVIDGKPFLSYAVDGMIVATPTGSTAYNLSARGPILSPRLQAILMTPVSPHMLFDRSLVLDPSETLELRVLGNKSAAVVVDGRHVATVLSGGSITCRPAQEPARLITLGKRDFRQVLKSKFGLADR